jgi:5-methyltetrahydropteroyltriglutamate--homocysteine methyltransferase
MDVHTSKSRRLLARRSFMQMVERLQGKPVRISPIYAISIGTTSLADGLLDAFVRYRYPNGIDPGVYDIHPPCVPDPAEMLDLLHKALDVLQPELWVSPDCGLKTRDWPEAEQALGHMAASGRLLRSTLAASIG